MSGWRKSPRNTVSVQTERQTRFASSLANDLPRQQRISRASDIVNSQDFRPLFGQSNRDTNGAGIAFFDFAAEDFFEKTFSRVADQYRSAESVKLGDV